MNKIITNKSKEKILQARSGNRELPVITGIALGSGGAAGGELYPLTPNLNMLQNELIRIPAEVEKISNECYRYRVTLATNQLIDAKINEAALYDAEGDLLVISVFTAKQKDANMELAFEFDDRF